MARRHRTDSLKGQQEIIKGASIVLDPPLGIELGDAVRPYWEKLVTSKATRSWTDADLLMLVELARNLYKTEQLSIEMIDADPTVEGQSGPKVNPLFGVVDQLVKRARIIMVMLQIHPEATHGKAKDQKKPNEDHQAAQQAIATQKDESLLATPTAH